jgi:protein MpaA
MVSGRPNPRRPRAARVVPLALLTGLVSCAPPPPIETVPRPAAAGLKVRRLGRSVEGRTVRAYVFDGPGPPILILGGFHGDEPSSVYVAQRLVDLLKARPDLRRGRPVVVVPNVNPDGYVRGTRCNARHVDLNRNFPTRNWKLSDAGSRYHGGPAPLSEPESQLVHSLVEELRPTAIISIHAIGRNRQCNNYDGPGQDLAELMARYNGYPPEPTIGYPTPGSFGTWAGKERRIPTLTLELPAAASNEQCWADNRQALLAAVQR